MIDTVKSRGFLAFVAAALLPVAAFGQISPLPTIDHIKATPTVAVDSTGADATDTTNHAAKVNCVAGCANGSITASTSAFADGSDVTQGTKADTAWTSGSGSIVSLLKAIDRDTLLPLATGSNAIGSITNTGFVNTDTVTGNVAAGATDSGNPVKAGGVYSATLPTLTDGQRGNVQLTTKGELLATLSYSGTAIAGTTDNADGVAATSTANSLKVLSRPMIYNGASWDRAFACTNSASVNVTAGSTTQIVALSGSTTIRVCSVSIGISATGTVAVSYGTGTNCSTGTTTLVAAMPLATGTLWQQTAPSGGSLFRSAAANALCISAVTGNVTGAITYAQF